MKGFETALIGTNAARDGGGELAFSGRNWRVRFEVEMIPVILSAADRSLVNVSFAPERYSDIRFILDGRAAALCVPTAELDQLFARIPDLGPITALGPDERALLLEHLLTRLLDKAEERLRLRIEVVAIEPRRIGVQFDEIPIRMSCEGRISALLLSMRDRQHLAQIGAVLRDLEAIGPGGERGMRVVVGPIRLPQSELSLLTQGDHLTLGQASLDSLSGLVLLDQDRGWPVEIIDGALKVTGGLRNVPSLPDHASLFLHVASLSETAPLHVGERVSITKLPEPEMVLTSGGRVLCNAGLVMSEQGLAIKIGAREWLK